MKTNFITAFIGTRRIKGTPKLRAIQEDYSKYVTINGYLPERLRQTIEEITPMIGNFAKAKNVTIEFKKGDGLSHFFGTAGLAAKFNAASIKTTIRNKEGKFINMKDATMRSSDKPERIREIYQMISNLIK